jgi:hypothetical protein
MNLHTSCAGLTAASLELSSILHNAMDCRVGLGNDACLIVTVGRDA